MSKEKKSPPQFLAETLAGLGKNRRRPRMCTSPDAPRASFPSELARSNRLFHWLDADWTRSRWRQRIEHDELKVEGADLFWLYHSISNFSCQ